MLLSWVSEVAWADDPEFHSGEAAFVRGPKKTASASPRRAAAPRPALDAPLSYAMRAAGE